MNYPLTRRQLLAGVTSSLLPAVARAETPKSGAYSFPLLGDLHLDRLEQHDMEWLRREKPNDVHQVEDYSRITREVAPGLLKEVREQVADGGDCPFIVHVGDFVEGLAGTPALARRQCEDSVRLVKEAGFGRPFLFCKGNHDITGPGAEAAFSGVLVPYLSEGLNRELKTSSYTVERGDTLFAYYDSYSRDSLAWLERTLERRRAGRLIVVIHQPVVPFGARANWQVFSRPEQKEPRDRLLRLLGRHRAIVLCGHLHKWGTVVRKTDEGPFVQLMVSSIISRPVIEPKDHLSGVDAYGPDQVRLEPKFAPDTLDLRREILAAEKPFIRQFEYADAPGYAMVDVDAAGVRARIFNGLGRRLWKTIDLTGLLSA